MGAGMWAGLTDMATHAMNGIEGVFDSTAEKDALASMGTIDGAEGELKASAASTLPNHGLTSSGKDPGWWHEGLKAVMPAIMGAAMKPKPQAHSAASGHGVQANPAGVMKPFEEVEKMANDNPLSGLEKFTHLF